MSPAHTLLELVHSNWMTQAICVAAELQIADLLFDGPKSSDELAALTKTDPSSLHRLLRALTTIDICRQDEDGRFGMTPTGALLATDAEDSLRHWVIWWGHHLWPVWGNLMFSVKTGKSARTQLTGTEGFGHLERDSATAEIFNRAMAELTALAAQGVVSAYDFGSARKVVDVGGGHGQLLAAILRANPLARGVLFDLPHAIDGAERQMNDAGVADRCEYVAGDFFKAVPAGADIYMLKSVIHDWNDDRARTILENCYQAMDANSWLLLVERILPKRLTTSLEHRALVRTDLSMLIALAAAERTEADFRDLLNSAGFEVSRIFDAGMGMSIVEARPRN